jgi:hypothetical protein
MAVLPRQFSAKLKERAQLAFTMVNLADAAGRKRMLAAARYNAKTVFGGFTTKFIQSRIQAAYPSLQPPELTKKQLAKLEAKEAYRTAVLNQVSLTNYEQNQFMLRRRIDKNVDPKSFIGCRGW